MASSVVNGKRLRLTFIRYSSMTMIAACSAVNVQPSCYTILHHQRSDARNQSTSPNSDIGFLCSMAYSCETSNHTSPPFMQNRDDHDLSRCARMSSTGDSKLRYVVLLTGADLQFARGFVAIERVNN